MEPCRAGISPQTLPLGGWDGLGGHRVPEATVFARSQKRPWLLCRDDADAGLCEAGDENLLSARRDIQDPRIPTQGSQRAGPPGRRIVTHLARWHVPPS